MASRIMYCQKDISMDDNILYVPSHMLTALKPNWCFDVLEKEAIMHSEWPEFSTYVDESNCSIRRSYHMKNCTSYSTR